MNFNVSLPHIPMGGVIHEARLQRTERIFECIICRKPTGWVRFGLDHPGVHCCSDECFDVVVEQEEELARAEQPTEPTSDLESPSSPHPTEFVTLVEVSLSGGPWVYGDEEENAQDCVAR